MKKILLIVLISLLFVIPVTAETTSLNTEITTVYMGPHNFGFGLAPTGTNFLFYRSFEMFPKLKNSAYFSTRITFDAYDEQWFGGFNYKTGTPKWINKYVDIKDNEDYKLSGYYFMPEATLDLYLEQGFGTNPISGEGPLVNVGIGFTSNYAMSYERLDVHRGEKEPVFFDPAKNNYIHPFGPGSQITAYPWLQDNRNSLYNYVGIYTNINLSKSRGFGASDGLRFSASFEYGPSWLGNRFSMKYPTSDFYTLNASLSQHLTLFVEKQDNGLNWLSIEFRHSNSYRYTDGPIVPMYKIPPDRLTQSFSDTWALKFNGPQFIAWDCYTDITLSLSNNCYFGHIVNEPSRSTQATEWKSKLGLGFHMRLFGFMHFSYDLGYNIFSGIHASGPSFTHDAKVYFYIAL